MNQGLGKYINPFTDFGFKKLFGEEANKDLLIDFLNALLAEKEHIKDITYLKNEHLGRTESDRKAIFDLYCETESGDKFIVEMQTCPEGNLYLTKTEPCITVLSRYKLKPAKMQKKTTTLGIMS